MTVRRTFIISIGTLLSGCGHRYYSPEGYEERIDSLAISPSGDALVILGSQFHYVFNTPRSLLDALRSDLRREFSASFQSFELDSLSDIHGQWNLLLTERSLNQDAARLARSLGFVSNGAGMLLLTGGIIGKRYRKNGFQQVALSEKTNSVYHVNVVRSRRFSDNESMRSSPVTSGGGDGLLLLGILLLPLLLVVNPCITCK